MNNEKPGGHGERSVAVGTIDMAVWDAVAKIAGKPLFRLLAERYGREADPRVFVYAAGGYYYPGKNLDALRAEMRSYLDRGYTVVKMKIGGAELAEDRQRIEAVLAEIGGDAQLAVDANGRFDLETAIAYAKMLREYPLFWYEEAGDPLDFALQAALAEFYPGPMATGENLFSHQDARNLLRYGGMRADRDWLQFDCALSYGLCEYLRTLEVVRGPAGRHAAAFRTAATRCRSTSPLASAWAATRATPTCSSRSADFPTACASKTATSPCPNCPASASRARPTYSRDAPVGRVNNGCKDMRNLRRDKPPLLFGAAVVAGARRRCAGRCGRRLVPASAVTLKPLGDGFIRLISMTLAPIIFLSIVVGIAGMGNLKEVGRVGVKALVYFEVVSTLALGLFAVNVLHPGRGMNIHPAALNSGGHWLCSSAQKPGRVVPAQHHSVQHRGRVFRREHAADDPGGCAVWAGAFAVPCWARPLLEILELVLKAMFGIVNLIMMLAPIGAFGAMAYSVGQYGLGQPGPTCAVHGGSVGGGAFCARGAGIHCAPGSACSRCCGICARNF